MPQVGQIMPDNQFSDIKVVVNDNTIIRETPSVESGDISMIFVINSPKGRDNKVITIDKGLSGYKDEFGEGPFSIYGQPALNARTALATEKVTGHILRVTAPDAGYAYLVIVAKYKIDDTGKMIVKLQKAAVDTTLMNSDELEDVYTPSSEPDADGFTEVKLFSVISLGRGAYGNSLAIRVVNNSSMDKENEYKNYLFKVYEKNTTLDEKSSSAVAFNEDALVGAQSLYSDAVVNDPTSGSTKIQLVTHTEGFQAIVDAYNAQNTDSEFTIDDFDVLLGIDKYTKTAIDNYVVDTTSDDALTINSVEGIYLENGTDGALEYIPGDKDALAAREILLNELYYKAFAGEIDPLIRSKNKFPTNVIFDANYDSATKQVIASLGAKRMDCMVILDAGTKITTKQSVIPYVKANFDGFVDHWIHCVDAYAGKIRDPYSNKVVTVTSTWELIQDYVDLWNENENAKHRSLAGNTQGQLTHFIKNTIYPVYDEDIDADVMNELVDMRVNFARLNSRQIVIRSSETTRQEVTSRMSDASNVFVVLDIVRDCRILCANYDYDFAEEEDIARFNKDVEMQVIDKYKDAQVNSITGVFSQNDFEAERDILHLNIEIVHKKKVKQIIIEVDINRE